MQGLMTIEQQYATWGGFGLILLLLNGYVGWVFVQRFRASTHGGFWHKVMDSSYDSLTIAWTKIWLVLNTLLVFADPIAGFLAGPDGQQFLAMYLSDPKTLALVSLALNAITYFVRMRSISAPALPNPVTGNV